MRFGAFGDMMLLIPALKTLQQRFGAPSELVSSGSWTAPLMQRVPACGGVRLLTSRRAPYWFNRSQQQLVQALRVRPAGPVYVFEDDEKPLALLRRAGIGPEWICSARDFSRQPGEHVAAHALRLSRQTPAALRGSPEYSPPSSLEPDMRPVLTETDRHDCAEWLAHLGLADTPLVLLQPGNKKTMKGGSRRRASNVDYWPEANWAHVITGVRRLLPAAHIIICGAPSERSLAEDIVSHLSGPPAGVLIATNELPIPRLLALQERAHSQISANTGPAHSAAAMGCPEVVMFTRHAHRAAELYSPLPTTGPVKIVFPDAAGADGSLLSIHPDTVVGTWHDMITGRGVPGSTRIWA